jgi:hypothetical protein
LEFELQVVEGQGVRENKKMGRRTENGFAAMEGARNSLESKGFPDFIPSSGWIF